MSGCGLITNLAHMHLNGNIVGGDVDSCEPINSHITGARLASDKVFHRLLEMRLKLDMRRGSGGGDEVNCGPIVHGQVCEGQARAILRASLAWRSLQPDLDSTEAFWEADKDGGRADDFGKKGNWRTANEAVATGKFYVPSSCDIGQAHVLYDWFDADQQEPRMYPEAAAGMKVPGCLKQVSWL